MTATLSAVSVPLRVPALVSSLGLVLGDLVSTLVFTGAYAVTHGLGLSFAVAVAAGVAGIVWTRRRGREVDAMQWLTLGLVVVFGVAALLTHDKRFIMLKPTLIYAAVGATMLKPGWITRYLPPIAQTHGADLARGFGYAWAASMFALAAANLALAAHGDLRLWAGFLAVAPLSLKAGLICVQYATTRLVVRRRVIAARGLR